MTEPETPTPSITALVEKLRADGWTEIADAVANGAADELPHEDRALVDAAMIGFGVLVHGRRMSPLAIRIINYEPRGSVER